MDMIDREGVKIEAFIWAVTPYLKENKTQLILLYLLMRFEDFLIREYFCSSKT